LEEVSIFEVIFNLLIV